MYKKTRDNFQLVCLYCQSISWYSILFTKRQDCYRVHGHTLRRRADEIHPGFRHQVWSLNKFYFVHFPLSRIGVKMCVFTNAHWRLARPVFEGLSTASAVHLVVSLILCSTGSNARGELRAPWRAPCLVSSKSPSRVRDGDKGFAGRNGREKYE